MAAAIDSVLFDWRDVEQFPQLHKLKLVLDVIPYQGLTEELARRRGKGRNDYPVEPMFRLLVAGIIFQHSSAAECLRNLKIQSASRGALRLLAAAVPAAPETDSRGKSARRLGGR